jgi:hypothetical protein
VQSTNHGDSENRYSASNAYLKGVYEILLYGIHVYPIWINFGTADVQRPLLSDSECSVNPKHYGHTSRIGVNEFLTVRFTFRAG